MTRTIDLRYHTYDEPETSLNEPQPKSVGYEFEINSETTLETLYLHFERFCATIGFEV
jgi:hypothetical protein